MRRIDVPARAVSPSLWRVPDAGLLPPGIDGLAADDAVCGGGHGVTLRTEVAFDQA